MKRLLACIAILAASTLFAQQAPPKSPAATETATIGGAKIAIDYNSPRVNGRAGHIFTKDGLIGKDSTYPVWRAGANAATKLHTDADLNIGGVTVPKGDYTLYVDISDAENWVLVINKQVGQWGTKYDKSQDLGRAKMTMDQAPALVENLRYSLKDLGGKKGTLSLAWENVIASVQFTVH